MLPKMWMLLFMVASLALVSATTSQHRSRLRTPEDKANALLVDIEHGVKRVSQDAKLTFEALDTYGKELEMSVRTKKGGTGGEILMSVKQLRLLEDKVRHKYVTELRRLNADAQRAQSQLQSLQQEKGEWQRRAQSCESVERAEHKLSVLHQSKVSNQTAVTRSGDAVAQEAADVVAHRELDHVRHDEKLIDQLKSENEGLQRRNQELEARLAASDSSGASVAGAAVPSTTALEQQVSSLKSDKEALVKTVQHLMKTNETVQLQQSLATMQQAKLSMELRCEKDKAALDAKIKAITAKDQDMREVAQSLQEQDLALQRTNEQMKEHEEEMKKAQTNLEADKNHLVQSLQSVLRQNTQYQSELAQQEISQSRSPKRKMAQSGAQPLHAQATSAEDSTYTMGETSAMDRYVEKTAREEAVETVNQPMAPTGAQPQRALADMAASLDERQRSHERSQHKPVASPLSNWLTTPDSRPVQQSSDADGIVNALSPVDSLMPPTAIAAAKKQQDEDAGFGDSVSSLLNQAEKAVADAGAF